MLITTFTCFNVQNEDFRKITFSTSQVTPRVQYLLLKNEL